MRLISVVGARPKFVKLAMMCHAAAKMEDGSVSHRIIHTGQHYDFELSDVFFRDLGIPAPDYHLGVGSGTHAVQTGETMKRIESILLGEPADWILLYGDTNSTLAGALAAAKLGMRVAHIEAGLRSYNRRMPEEINRLVTDVLCDLLLCPTAASLENLRREGLDARALLVGDVMYDASLYFRDIAERRGSELAAMWKSGGFALATIHRPGNTDDVERLAVILRALEHIARHICPVVFPLHPRTRKAIASARLGTDPLTILGPVSYLEMLMLERRAQFILTDSGGIQKEAYFAKTPCITFREETEWVETLENRCNVLADADEEAIIAAAQSSQQAGPWTAIYGEGHAAEAILAALRNV